MTKILNALEIVLTENNSLTITQLFNKHIFELKKIDSITDVHA